MIIKYFIIVQALTFSLISFAVEETKCPSNDDQQTNILNRKKTVLIINQNISDLLNGKIVNDFSPSTLFTIDINDEKKVENRIIELNKNLEISLSDTLKSHPYFTCAESSEILLENLTSLIEEEKKSDTLRLEFLSLAKDKKVSLLNLQEQALFHIENIKNLEEEKQEALIRSEKADDALKMAEESAQKEKNANLRELSEKRILLEKYRKEAAELNLAWANKLQDISIKANEYYKSLTKRASILSQGNPSDQDLIESYTVVTQIWRNLLDDLFVEKQMNLELLPLPENPKIILDLNENESIDYSKSYESAKLEYASLVKLKNDINKSSKDNQYKMILLAGKIRSQLIKELKINKNSEIFLLSNDNISDLLREIKLVPYRPLVIVKNFILNISEKLYQGFSGWLALFNQLILLILFIGTPILTYLIMLKGTRKLEVLRAWLIRNGRSNKFYLQSAYWIYNLNPYIPWLILYFSLRSAGFVIEDSDLEGLSEVLPYFEYYFIYKIFRITLSQMAVALSELSHTNKSINHLSFKIEKTGKFVGIFFLMGLYILVATEAAAREALFYNCIENVLWIFSPLVLAIASSWWADEITAAAENLFPDFLSRKVFLWINSRLKILICFPTLILIIFIVILKKIYSYAVKMESAKRVSAQLFRRKLDSNASQANNESLKNDLDLNYKSFFHFGPPEQQELMVFPNNSPHKEICKKIHTWIEEVNDEHTIAIQGEKGIGKSTTLNFIENYFGKDIKVVKYSISQKITTSTNFFIFLSEIFGSTISGIDDVLKFDKNTSKTVFLIDEGQNLFLGKRKGFEALHLLNTIFNLRTENIFWCVSFNMYSWAYLNSVTGGSKLFRKTYCIDQWSDTDLKKLIINRHEKTGYTLEFDPILYATSLNTQKDDLKYIQDRFFEMLWDQSKGNPRTAITLWLSALTQVSSKKISVGIPESSPVRPLDGLTDDELFVVSAIVKHENLDVQEAVSVCCLHERIVRHALRVGLERGFLTRSDNHGRYRVHPVWQAPLISQLVSKNFVYDYE